MFVMEILKGKDMVHYISEDCGFTDDIIVGKWVYYFDRGGREFVEKICKGAIEKGVTSRCSHSNNDMGVACFYVNIDDIEGHKKVIGYFLENNLVYKTKGGMLYNMSFKLNTPNSDGKYDCGINLYDFVNLNTGEWLV